MEPKEVGQHLIVHPAVCHGKLTFKGTRVPVQTILNWLAKGKTLDSILSDWPYLSREAVAEAIQLATVALEERHTFEAKQRNESVHPRRTTRGERGGRAASRTA